MVEGLLADGWAGQGLSNEVKKMRPPLKDFSLKDFSDFLPISKSRRQLSLDSSPTPRCGQWLHIHS